MVYMRFAYDHNDRRIHIDNTHSDQDYFCPFCGAPLITRKGDIYRHHFAHKKNSSCTDTWNTSTNRGGYNMSSWHDDWQARFPKENQEIRLSLGEIVHRADVLVGNTVIEFQHSSLSIGAYNDRVNFYFGLGYKVIWLFDMTDLYDSGKLRHMKDPNSNNLIFSWDNPKKAFRGRKVMQGAEEIFLQLDDNSIVKVLRLSGHGFESFLTSPIMSPDDFLAYVGLHDGTCSPPYKDDELDERYLAFKEKYHVQLNKQQERALQTVSGYNLLLAVPGSGKTTTLVNRLGHMVLNVGIDPQNILAITFNRAAAEEMKKRAIDTFGVEIGEGVTFKTINSLCNGIYDKYYDRIHERKRIINERSRKWILSRACKDEWEYSATESEIQDFSSMVGFIKNMMLTNDEVEELEAGFPDLLVKYLTYICIMMSKDMMDFDDQMIFALEILENNEDVLTELRQQYRYICVDEAQDTSKLQHKIISLLAQDNNLFMVGDEDQSIYKFRGSYPQALLNFKYDYPNPYVLNMETNYRSTGPIVDAAQRFISRNKGRYEKHMTAERKEGEPISLIKVKTREEQYHKLLNVAKTTEEEVAFLYRENESAVVLADLLSRHDVPFKLLRKPEINFFQTPIVQDVKAYLSLAINKRDYEAFDQICNKGILYLKSKQRWHAIKNVKEREISVFKALQEQMEYESYDKHRAKKFQEFVGRIRGKTPEAAISILLDDGYEEYLKKNHPKQEKIEVLQILAKRCCSIEEYLTRLEELEDLLMSGYKPEDSKVILSTIHTSKGLEYKTVYMVDIYDGRLPSSIPDQIHRSKDRSTDDQEERRLFYVGITRAKDKLCLFDIEDRPSSYIDELFPNKKGNDPI